MAAPSATTTLRAEGLSKAGASLSSRVPCIISQSDRYIQQKCTVSGKPRFKREGNCAPLVQTRVTVHQTFRV